MTESDRAVIARLSADVAAISWQLARVSAGLAELDRVSAGRSAAPQPPPMPVASRSRAPRDTSAGWSGKSVGAVLAVAGVAVTLVGVVLLLVLAAQAGILRPEVRVVAGGLLAVALVTVGCRMHGRDGGRVGAIALTATGIAAAYFDVVAVTSIYEWVAAPVGLVLAAAVGGGGLALARRWDAEHLGLLVLVPLIALAPVLTEGLTLLLVGFMLALSAATLPVQLGKDWLWLQAARTAAVTLPLLGALAATAFGGEKDLLLAAACGIAALFVLAGALLVLPGTLTARRAAMALLTAAGLTPVLCVSLTADRVVAALMSAALAAALLAIVLSDRWLPAVQGPAREIWSASSAVCALVAVTVAFDGEVAAPLLLATATVIAVAARHDAVARWSALGFALVGGALYLAYAPPDALVRAVVIGGPDAVSVLISSVLLIAAAIALARCWTGAWAVFAVVVAYAVTAFAVTAGVLIGGTGGGFFGGHVAATICWIGAATGLLGYAARRPKPQRAPFIGAGLALVGAAVAKLFLFDLGTLDGMFGVAVFLVVGLILLGMGAGYARVLERRDVTKITN